MARQHLPIEPPLPVDLQQEIEASVDRFRAMFPALIRGVAEEYVPRYRAEITSLIRRTYTWALDRGASLGDRRVMDVPLPPHRPETSVQGETTNPEETK